MQIGKSFEIPLPVVFDTGCCDSPSSQKPKKEETYNKPPRALDGPKPKMSGMIRIEPVQSITW